MRRLLPILLALIGLAAGVGAGVFLRPAPQAEAPASPCGNIDDEGANEGHGATPGGSDEATHEYVKLNNQFIVPVVEGGAVSSLVILSISLEVVQGSTDAVYAIEPKLRDGLLRVMFDHANAGGFDGAFTATTNLDLLRAALREAAAADLGERLVDVLITDIVRQDG